MRVDGALSVVDVAGDQKVQPGQVTKNYYYYNEIIGNDQYSQIVFSGGVNDSCMGPAVRGASGALTCYYWYADASGSSYLRRSVAGVEALLASGGTFVAGSTYRLEAIGDELRCYKDGVLDTSINGTGIYDDSGSADKISSGYVGIMGYGTDATYADDWEGGEL